MARYESEFAGLSAGFRQPSGADPNYRGGYRGMRMWGGEGTAPYGGHRYRHQGDLGGSGGWSGIHPHYEPRMSRVYDAEQRRSGVRRFGDPRLMHDFNASSPAYRGRRPQWSGEEFRPTRREGSDRDWDVDRRYRGGYSNRGVGEGGYSEPWARFPMRGGR